ncbi:hypothetical protein CEXT_790791 [Caerostris extrusa]|uniref:Uncharacterized protein n=1 Tax=Caerostris extrusa TaxID=172846 RepID=A0AAV4W002_CAEEX|nr:hypothetical protein CEXT_790791 [Caerostris extrusa]
MQREGRLPNSVRNKNDNTNKNIPQDALEQRQPKSLLAVKEQSKSSTDRICGRQPTFRSSAFPDVTSATQRVENQDFDQWGEEACLTYPATLFGGSSFT